MWVMVRPHDVEQRPGTFEVALAAANHDGENAVDSALLAAADGGIEHGCLPGRKLRSDFPGHQRIDRAHVDQQQPVSGGFQYAIGAQDNPFDVRRVGQHRNHNAGGLGDLFRRTRPVGARVRQFLNGPLATVVNDQREARPDQVQRHGFAHDPESDESDDRLHGREANTRGPSEETLR